MPKNFLKHLPVIFIALLPLVYLLIIWTQLPEEIPMHYGINGNVDRYGNKAELMIVMLLMTGVSIGTYALVTNIHKIDPKQAKKNPIDRFQKIASGVVLFMTIINLVIVINSGKPELKIMDKVLLPCIGLLFMFLGNYMYNIKPNYFVGIRVPWTLDNDEIWKKTHQLAAVLFFIGGLVMIIVALMSSFMIAIITVLALSIIVSIIPMFYAYSLFKKLPKEK